MASLKTPPSKNVNFIELSWIVKPLTSRTYEWHPALDYLIFKQYWRADETPFRRVARRRNGTRVLGSDRGLSLVRFQVQCEGEVRVRQRKGVGLHSSRAERAAGGTGKTHS